jgi:aspartate dehydrogenase
LIADPNISTNIHEIVAEGAFGQFRFEISGKALPDNPSSSALAAMSVVASIEMQSAWILF